MMNRVIVGIDPGKDGAVAVCTGDSMCGANLPYDDRYLDVKAFRDMVLLLAGNRIDTVCLELCRNYKMNGRSAESFFTGYGSIIAVCSLMEWPLSLKTPQAWQKGILGHTTSDKSEAIAYVKRRWPMVELPRSKAKASGVADACCIAEFAYST